MPIDDPPGERLKDVIMLLIDVQQQLDGENDLESLARRSGYSPFHFHRFFSRAVGETPKQHVARLRLERAAYKLAITDETVLQVALSVGFNNHETFSRAFKRAFGYTPKDYRQACKSAQAARLKRNEGFRGDGCVLSEVRFVNLPAMTLLGIRRYGAYADCPTPFLDGDKFWSKLVAWAKTNGVSYRQLPIAISYDDPTVTPASLQRLDACIQVSGEVKPHDSIRRLEFAGGWYGGIDHAGPLSTIDQAYSALADGIRRSKQYDFGLDPPIQVYRTIHFGGDAAANLTEVFFPVGTRD
jgi:AraC family transcriptional regulator